VPFRPADLAAYNARFAARTSFSDPPGCRCGRIAAAPMLTDTTRCGLASCTMASPARVAWIVCATASAPASFVDGSSITNSSPP